MSLSLYIVIVLLCCSSVNLSYYFLYRSMFSYEREMIQWVWSKIRTGTWRCHPPWGRETRRPSWIGFEVPSGLQSSWQLEWESRSTIQVLEDPWLCLCLSVWACDPIYSKFILIASNCFHFRLDYNRKVPISKCRWQSASSQLSRSSALSSPRNHCWFPLMLRKSGSKLQHLQKGSRKVRLSCDGFIQADDNICRFNNSNK